MSKKKDFSCIICNKLIESSVESQEFCEKHLAYLGGKSKPIHTQDLNLLSQQIEKENENKPKIEKKIEVPIVPIKKKEIKKKSTSSLSGFVQSKKR